MEKLREQYEKEVVPAMMKKFNYKSIMEVPKLEKIVINVGLGDTKDNPKALDNAMNDIKVITGQAPVVTRAKKALMLVGDPKAFLNGVNNDRVEIRKTTLKDKIINRYCNLEK